MHHFRVLGWLEARVNGELVRFDSPKQRAILIALLSQANNMVPMTMLLDWLWPDGDLPRSATGVVQAHVSHLRRILEPDRPRWAEPQLLLTRRPGYLLKVTADQVDTLTFENLVHTGRDLLGREEFQPAVSTLTEALALWRGPALADLDGAPAVRAVVVRWEELRKFATVMKVEAELELGRHLCVIGDLEGLVAAHPFDERLHGLLILALYRCRRRADALTAYRRMCHNLAGELGTEPAPALRFLRERVLEQAPELDWISPRKLI